MTGHLSPDEPVERKAAWISVVSDGIKQDRFNGLREMQSPIETPDGLTLPMMPRCVVTPWFIADGD
jgi:hypothetical protein